MIQRKQSLYFLGVFIISLILIWVNPTFYSANGKTTGNTPKSGLVEVGYSTTQMTENGSMTEAANTLMSSTILIMAFTALVCIFFFKNRKWQMILASINFLFLFALLYIMYSYSFKIDYFVAGTGETKLTPWSLLPLSILLFNFLGYRGVLSDEKLIRSVDRLR
jgi:hypothetical protein